MWPLSSYPELAPKDVHGQAYDYIVVGGGTAGCVLASRLSEDPSVSVLLIEKGHVKDNVISRSPLLSQNFFWTKLLQVQDTIWSEPVESAYKRTVQLFAVNGIGGASRINAMLWTRGSPGNYTAWSQDLGLSEWSWNKVEPYFRKTEHVIGPAYEAQSDVRGREGPVEICRPAYSFQWPAYLREATKSVGLATSNTLNDPRTPSCGFFPLDTAIDQSGKRVSALSAYLNKDLARQRSKHLKICTGAVASRLEIAPENSQGDRIVTGVYFKSSAPSKPSKEYFVKAKREIILTCGAMTTPQLLLLSGIGPRQGNSTRTDLGIPIVKELPAVGADLSDHYAIPIMLELPRKETLHILEGAIWGLWYMLLWLLRGRGLFGVSAAPAAAFLHTDHIDERTMQVKESMTEDKHRIPNVEIMILPINSLGRAVPGRSLFSFYTTIVQPHGKGRVEITSTDPLTNPKIQHPMFGHDDDLKTGRMAVRFAMRWASEMQAKYPTSVPLLCAPGEESNMPLPDGTPRSAEKTFAGPEKTSELWKSVTDDDIDDFMRRTARSALHFASTCPMGTSEENGVVDQQLLVFGFTNLRIADASVIPKITSAHTMAPVLMIAERCADFVKGKWTASQKW